MPSARCQGTGDAGCSRRVSLGSLSMAVRASLVMMVLSACAACAPTGQQAAPQRVPAPAVTRPWVPPVQNRVTDYPSPGPGWLLGGVNETNIDWLHFPSHRREGSVVRVWTIANLATRASAGYLSVRTQMEYQCTQRQSRILSILGFSDVNAGGTPLGAPSDFATPWTPIAPNTIGEVNMAIACHRR